MSALPPAAAELLRRVRGEEVAAARPLRGGANSEAWEVLAEGGARYFVKRYPRPGAGETSRLGTELRALRFLRAHGERAVPEPVAEDAAERIGLFGLVAGRRLGADEVGEEHVRQALAFLGRLHALRGAPGAESLPEAKEACFSLAAHERLLRRRLAALADAPPGPERAALGELLAGEIGPQLERTAAWVAAEAPRRGLDPGSVLPEAARTLSPSDFGFHNALLRDDGGLVFVDLEYFGWDDPAKAVADFLLQPAVPVPPRLHGAFLSGAARVYGAAADLERRLPLVSAFLACKWCLIVLNLFLRPGGGEAAAPERAGRLRLARRLLERARGAVPGGEVPAGGAMA